MSDTLSVPTTALGDALRDLALLADAINLDDALVHPTQTVQVTVRTSEDVHRFAQHTGADVRGWESDDTWFTYAENFKPRISLAVVSIEPVPRELRRPVETTELIEEKHS